MELCYCTSTQETWRKQPFHHLCERGGCYQQKDVESFGTTSSINPNNIRLGTNQPFNEYLNAGIDEVRYYNRLLSLSEIQSDMNTPIDNTAPTVNISGPTNGSSVNGTINVNANASDNVGVVGVQFLLDGVNLGTEDVAAPYSISWNTTATMMVTIV